MTQKPEELSEVSSPKVARSSQVPQLIPALQDDSAGAKVELHKASDPSLVEDRNFIRRVPKSQRINFKPVKIYLDDVEIIYNILQEISEDISIETDEYAIKDIKQLSRLNKERITMLRFKVLEPFITLDLTPHEAQLYISGDDLVSVGVFEKLKKAVARRQRFSTLSFRYIWLIALPVSFLLSQVILSLGRKDYTTAWLSFAGFAIGILWYLYNAYQDMNRHSLIILKYRRDTPSFWRRNADNIKVELISGTFGAILGAVLGVIATLLAVKMGWLNP